MSIRISTSIEGGTIYRRRQPYIASLINGTLTLTPSLGRAPVIYIDEHDAQELVRIINEAYPREA